MSNLTDVHFVRYVKTALAVALIKNKPENSTAQAYAEQICGKFQASQLQWKEKAVKLEEQLLHLNQKIFLAETKALPETLEVRGSNEAVYPTPPLSEHVEQIIEPQAKLSQNVTFLKSFIALKSVKNTQHLRDENYVQTAIKTIQSSIKCMQQWLCDREFNQLLSVKLVQETVDTMVALVGKSGSADFTAAVSQALVRFVQYGVVAIMKNQAAGQMAQQDKIADMITKLSACHQLCHKIIHILTTCIKEFTDLLRQSNSTCSLVEPHLFENVFYILKILENGLENLMKRTLTRDVTELLGTVKDMLDSSVVHISDSHPLLCHYIWHIVGLVDRMLFV